MKKSKNIFLIMSIIYFAVAVLGELGYLSISENILLGLSLSALLSSISDILYNIRWKLVATNELGYTLHVTLKFLLEKKAHNAPIHNPSVNIIGVRQYVEGMSKKYKNALYPAEYSRKKILEVLEALSQICFILSIASFMLPPFLPSTFQISISTMLTLSAFAAMCLNLYITESLEDIMNKRNDDFANKEQLIIQTAYPDFNDFLSKQYWLSAESVIEETQEVKPDAHT